MSDIEDIPSPNPATLQALRDIVEDMEQMVKDAGGGDDNPPGPGIAADQSSREDEEMGGDINAALCRDSDIDDIDNDTNESNDDVIITAACAETATASKELPKAVERAAMAANVVGCQPQPVTAAVAGAENCSTCRLPGSTDLIVDVHLESSEDIPRPPCVKHSFHRFPRCYSESRGNMSREEFRNLDRIETIGEERLRHMSEGAGRLRTRWRDSRGIFGSDKGMVQGSGGGVPGGVGAATSKSERKYQISEYDISVSSSNLGSLEDLESIASSSCSRLNLKSASRDRQPRPLSSKLEPAAATTGSTRSFSGGMGGKNTGVSCGTGKLEENNGLPEVKFEIYNEGNAGFEVDDGYYEGGEHRGMYTNIHPSLESTPRYKEEEFGQSFKSTMSSSSSTTSMPICRICQLPSIEPSNHLISPCRCLGSIRYVHNPCLLKWLEVCSRKNSDAPCCELCQFQYIRKKRFVISQCMFPVCSTRDRVLHSIFLLCVALMVTCAGVTILCFKQDRDGKPKTVGPNTELSPSELMTLCCGVLFFLAFFVAMYVEVKAKNTVYQLICKFLYMNYDWTIQEYDRKKDPAKQIEDS